MTEKEIVVYSISLGGKPPDLSWIERIMSNIGLPVRKARQVFTFDFGVPKLLQDGDTLNVALAVTMKDGELILGTAQSGIRIDESYLTCPDRRDDSYMEGEGAMYCMQYGGPVKEQLPRPFMLSWDCHHNCENGRCPRGYRKR